MNWNERRNVLKDGEMEEDKLVVENDKETKKKWKKKIKYERKDEYREDGETI